MTLFSIFQILVLVALAALVVPVLLGRGRGDGGRMGAFLPVDAIRVGWGVRLVESSVLLLEGAAVWALIAMNPSTNGMLLRLDQLAQWDGDVALAHLTAAVCAGLGVVTAAVLALVWRLRLGTLLMAGVLVGYALLLNGPGGSLVPDPIRARGRGRWHDPDTVYTIRLSPDIEDAELWVNGVYLGATPVTMSLGEFVERVPVWDKEEAARQNAEGWRQPYHEAAGERHRTWLPWGRFPVPSQRGNQRDYYGRARLRGHWSYTTGRSGGHGTGTAHGATYVTEFGVLFPELEKEFDRLLDAGRARDYRADGEWFGGLVSYGTWVWPKLVELVPSEPGIQRVLDQWAAAACGIGRMGIQDEASAWRVLERIAVEADRVGSFDTHSPEGRAVELLAPRLSEEQVVAWAEELALDRRDHAVGWRWIGGRLHFSRPKLNGEMGADQLPPHAYVAAHAVRCLDEWLDARDPQTPNIVERRVVPALIRRHYRNHLAMKAAVALGGPAVSRFVLRQNWRAAAQSQQQDWANNRMRAHGMELNRWLHYILQLDDAEAEDFRQRHRNLCLDHAESCLGPEGSSVDVGRDLLTFLFRENDAGPNNLAMRFWPRYEVLADQAPHNALASKWWYLCRIRPEPPLDLVAQTWCRAVLGQATLGVQELWGQVNSEMKHLTAAAQLRVLRALADENRRLIATGLEATGRSHEQARLEDSVVPSLERRLLELGDDDAMQRLLAEMTEPDAEERRRQVGDWLTYGQPGHPLVQRLTSADSPVLRLLVPAVVREHPTPTNRASLARLLSDPDEEVKAAAAKVDDVLKTLVRRPEETGPFASEERTEQEGVGAETDGVDKNEEGSGTPKVDEQRPPFQDAGEAGKDDKGKQDG